MRRERQLAPGDVDRGHAIEEEVLRVGRIVIRGGRNQLQEFGRVVVQLGLRAAQPLAAGVGEGARGGRDHQVAEIELDISAE